MKDPYKIIKSVAITEKTNSLMEDNQYVFIVNKNAKKIDIKLAVQVLFERKVKCVNTMNRVGKTKRNKYGIGKRPDIKKAIVTLKKGEDAIDLF